MDGDRKGWTGVAAWCAVGNGWVIYGYDDRPGDDPTTSTNAFEIDVAVDTAQPASSATRSTDVTPTNVIAPGSDTSAIWLLRWSSNERLQRQLQLGRLRHEMKMAPQRQSKTSDPLGATEAVGCDHTSQTEHTGR